VNVKKAVIFLVSVCLCALLAVVGIWYFFDSSIPKLVIKQPIYPVPNAFDYYYNAQALLVDKDKTASLSKIVANQSSHGGVVRDSRTYREIKNIIARNTNALSGFRKGFPYKYQAIPWEGPEQLFYYYAGFRYATVLFSLDSQAKAAEGDYNAAMSDCLDAMKIGNDSVPGIGAISCLVGIACEGNARGYIWDYIDRLNASQSLAALRRLQKIRASAYPLYRTMEDEKNNNVILAYQMCGYYPGRQTVQEFLLMPVWEKRCFILMTRECMNEAVFKSSLPYPIASRIQTQYTSKSISAASWGDRIELILYTNMVPVYNKMVLKYTVNETHNNLLETSIALHVYKLNKGSYPDSLSQLSPEYCKQALKDPFTEDKLLRYKKTSKSYSLYSVGPDGKDDQGQVITVRNKIGKIDINAASKGDIITGPMR
jgi:hypothetical protein